MGTSTFDEQPMRVLRHNINLLSGVWNARHQKRIMSSDLFVATMEDITQRMVYLAMTWHDADQCLILSKVSEGLTWMIQTLNDFKKYLDSGDLGGNRTKLGSSVSNHSSVSRRIDDAIEFLEKTRDHVNKKFGAECAVLR